MCTTFFFKESQTEHFARKIYTWIPHNEHRLFLGQDCLRRLCNVDEVCFLRGTGWIFLIVFRRVLASDV